MKISCISDTHQHHKKIIMPETDMIIHAGDFTYYGKLDEVKNFLDWYEDQDAKYKLLVCGNHEVEISKDEKLLKTLCDDRGIQLLNNTYTIIDGITIFGSPYSAKFGNWAYMMNDDKLQDIWNMIDSSIDILITHGPAYGNLDLCPDGRVGSKTLQKHISEKLEKLQLHVTGHIHESRGTMISRANSYNYLTVNASICGIPYTDIVINPITVEIGY